MTPQCTATPPRLPPQLGHRILQCIDKNQQLLLQFIVFLMMDAKGYSAYQLWHPLQDLFHPNSRQKPAAVTTVYSVPDDGRKGCQWKHVEFLTPNKEHEKVASCWHLYDQCTVTFNKILWKWPKNICGWNLCHPGDGALITQQFLILQTHGTQIGTDT